MTQKYFYTFDEIKDEFLSVKGTLRRNEYEKAVSDTLQAYKKGIHNEKN